MLIYDVCMAVCSFVVRPPRFEIEPKLLDMSSNFFTFLLHRHTIVLAKLKEDPILTTICAKNDFCTFVPNDLDL